MAGLQIDLVIDFSIEHSHSFGVQVVLHMNINI